MPLFSQLHLHERLLKALSELGFHQPTDVQRQGIPLALEGRDLFAIARTGTGKTAAFVLPVLQRLLDDDNSPLAPRALILSPTRELAMQILADFEALARFTFIKAELVIGGEDFKVQAARLRRNPDVVIATPGRALEQLAARNLELTEVKVLVIDEADRMLDMGFSDDVIAIANACPDSRQTLLYSATRGDRRLATIIENTLNNPEWLELDDIRKDTLAIRQQVIPADDNPHKMALLSWLLAHEHASKAMIFTNTRERADELYRQMQRTNVRAYVLHGDKDQRVRKQTINQFKNISAGVLIATDVAARGLDIDDLALVINFDMPRSGDDYVHRIGRTGRAGAEGMAISLVSAPEWNLMSSIERYLRRQFERRLIDEVPGNFKGPKKVKSSGKPVGSKKKKADKNKTAGKKSTAKKSKVKKPATRAGGKRLSASSDGLAPLSVKRKPKTVDP